MIFYLTALILGLCLSAMGLGIFITMKVFRIPDITTDGSYTLGAAVTAVFLTRGWPLPAIIGVAMAAGAMAACRKRAASRCVCRPASILGSA